MVGFDCFPFNPIRHSIEICTNDQIRIHRGPPQLNFSSSREASKRRMRKPRCPVSSQLHVAAFEEVERALVKGCLSCKLYLSSPEDARFTGQVQFNHEAILQISQPFKSPSILDRKSSKSVLERSTGRFVFGGARSTSTKSKTTLHSCGQQHPRPLGSCGSTH